MIFTVHEGDTGLPEQWEEESDGGGGKERKKGKHLKNEQVNEARRASGQTEEKRQRCAVVWSDSITSTA